MLREWLAIRKRVDEEFRFHLERTEADLLAFGVSRREARRTARRRLGARQTRHKALSELGGDLAGFMNLFQDHQISASAWIRPLGVAMAIALLLAISPDSRAVLQGVDGRPQMIRSIPEMVIAKTMWACIAFVMPFVLGARRSEKRLAPLWFAYGLIVLGLHALASIIAWGVVMQAWRHIHWRTDGTALLGLIALLFVYTGAVMTQCRCWWRDLFRRCPICLEGLRLPLAEGTADRVLLSPISTESVCIHGHGVLLENRWLRSFRRQDPHWEQLIRA